MKKILFVLLLLSTSMFSQKNIITVPLAEVVGKKKVLVQPGISASEDLLQVGNILTFGFGSNFQGGITVTDVTFNYGPEGEFFPVEKVQPGLNPDVLINFHKGFKLSNKTWVAIGTLTGGNIAGEGINLSMFSYINGQTTLFGDNMVVLGVYHGEETRLVTDEKKFGFLAGLQVPVSQKVNIVADYISGNNARSYINTGLSIKLSSDWSLIPAVGFPAPDSGNKTLGIIQLSYTSK